MAVAVARGQHWLVTGFGVCDVRKVADVFLAIRLCPDFFFTMSHVTHIPHVLPPSSQVQ